MLRTCFLCFSMLIVLLVSANTSAENDVKFEELEPVSFSEERTYGGYIRPLNEQIIHNDYKGFISYIAHEGTKVKKGDVVLKIRRAIKILGEPDYKALADISGVVTWSQGNQLGNFEENAPLLKIASYDDLLLEVTVPYEDLLELDLTQKVKIILAPNTPYEMTVDGSLLKQNIDTVLFNNYYRVSFAFSCTEPANNQDCVRRARLGSLAMVKVDTNQRDVLAIRSNLIEDNRVLIVDNQGLAHWRDVTLGREFNDKIEVIDGLIRGDRVVNSYTYRPIDGETLNIVN